MKNGQINVIQHILSVWIVFFSITTAFIVHSLSELFESRCKSFWDWDRYDKDTEKGYCGTASKQSPAIWLVIIKKLYSTSSIIAKVLPTYLNSATENY